MSADSSSNGYQSRDPRVPPPDLKTRLNATTTAPAYTRIADLRLDIPYLIASFERVTTPYGESVMVMLEGDEDYMRVYLPRRYNDTITNQDILRYNSGYADRLRLVRRSGPPGSNYSPLEFL